MQLRLAASALNQTPLDWAGNQARILALIQEAKTSQVDILCLPELCIPGYECMDHFYSKEVVEQSWQTLMEILPYTTGIGLNLGLPLFFEGFLYNAIAWVVDGRIEGFALKEVLANRGVYYEARWFTPWPAGREALLVRENHSYPLGHRLFSYQTIKLTFEICEEAWIQDRTVCVSIKKGAQLVLNPSASHFSFDKHLVRRQLLKDICSQYKIAYLFSNQLGNSAGRLLYDGHMMVASSQQLIEGPLGSFQEHQLLFADYDTASHHLLGPVPEPIVWDRHQQFTQMIALGLWDLFRKTKTTGFVVSLSGGVDSSVCACLVYFMALFVEKELGIHLEMREILSLMYQRTAQNSLETEKAANDLAHYLKASYHCIDIEPLFQTFQEMASSHCLEGKVLNWADDDIALQNLQARLRSPAPWLLANVKNALLLATSNRSECSVGYATMDGDTSGSFSPLAGIDKPFLQSWLTRIKNEGYGILSAPLDVLDQVLFLPPSAELRPPASPQTDEADLMPYPVLNAIERLFCVDFLRSVDPILDRLKDRFPMYSVLQLRHWCERFLLLWYRNQWKRERFAPSFHIDEYSVDPKSDARYPILH